MVMSGSSTDKEEVPLDWSFENHAGELLRRGNHPRSNFKRCILDNADLTEGNFVNSNFHRASMVEVMNAQYIRTARLKGMSFISVVFKHALRNALIAPFTVIMLQFPWLLTGVVIVEKLFNYKGFGFLLVAAADQNDIDVTLACGVVAVILVLTTQLISDIGYALLNPRIRFS